MVCFGINHFNKYRWVIIKNETGTGLMQEMKCFLPSDLAKDEKLNVFTGCITMENEFNDHRISLKGERDGQSEKNGGGF